jgi:hypothetical protein
VLFNHAVNYDYTALVQDECSMNMGYRWNDNDRGKTEALK